jgi:hypothetical protein
MYAFGVRELFVAYANKDKQDTRISPRVWILDDPDIVIPNREDGSGFCLEAVVHSWCHQTAALGKPKAFPGVVVTCFTQPPLSPTGSLELLSLTAFESVKL